MTPEQHAYIFQQPQEPSFAIVASIWDRPRRAAIIRTAAEHKWLFGHVPSPGFPPPGHVLLVPAATNRSIVSRGEDWSREADRSPLDDIRAAIDADERRRGLPRPVLVTEGELAVGLSYGVERLRHGRLRSILGGAYARVTIYKPRSVGMTTLDGWRQLSWPGDDCVPGLCLVTGLLFATTPTRRACISASEGTRASKDL